jgi:hypothetical protein
MENTPAPVSTKYTVPSFATAIAAPGCASAAPATRTVRIRKTASRSSNVRMLFTSHIQMRCGAER